MGKGIKQGGGGGGAANGIKVIAKGLDNIKPNMFATFDGSPTNIVKTASAFDGSSSVKGIHLWDDVFFYWGPTYAYTVRINPDGSATRINRISAGSGHIYDSMPIRLTENRIVKVAMNSNGSASWVVVDVDSSGNITLKKNVSISITTSSNTVIGLAKVDDSHVLLVTYNSSNIYARVITVSSDGTATLGTQLTVSLGNGTGASSIVRHSNGVFYCAGVQYTYGLKVTGTSVSFVGSVYTFTTGNNGHIQYVEELSEKKLILGSVCSAATIDVNEDGTLGELKWFKSNLAYNNSSVVSATSMSKLFPGCYAYVSYTGSTTQNLQLLYSDSDTPHGLYRGTTSLSNNYPGTCLPYNGKVVANGATELAVADITGTVTAQSINKNCLTKSSFREGSEGKVLI